MSVQTYSLSGDFGGNLNTEQLHNEILNDGGITTSLIGVTLKGDNVNISFVSALGGSEVTALNNLVAAYTFSSPINYFDLEVVSAQNVTDGQILMYNATNWTKTNLNFSVMGDTCISGNIATDSLLVWTGTCWLDTVRNVSGVTQLSELSDVNTSGQTDGRLLVYNNGTWVTTDNLPNLGPMCVSGNIVTDSLLVWSGTCWFDTVRNVSGVTQLSELSDVNTAGQTDGRLLVYDNGTWVTTDNLPGLGPICVSNDPISGSKLAWTGTCWADTVTLAPGLVSTEAAGTISTTSTTYQNALSLDTGNIVNGNYRILWYYEWRGDQTTSNRYFDGLVQLDGVTPLGAQYTAERSANDTSVSNSVSGFTQINLSTGTHVVDILYRRQGAAMTVFISRRKLEFLRIE